MAEGFSQYALALTDCEVKSANCAKFFSDYENKHTESAERLEKDKNCVIYVYI